MIFNRVKIFILLLICWNGINASDISILCKHESLTDTLGNKMFTGCANGQLRSISVQEENHPRKYWVFIGAVKEVKNGKSDFVLSEAYIEIVALRNKGEKNPQNDDVLHLDTMFFQKGRKVFLRIHRSPRDTVLQLNEPVVTLNENIEIVRLQKADIFTSDSIKMPNITISRGHSGIDFIIAEIKDFQINLIDSEFIMQFDYVNKFWRNEIKRHQYKFRIP